MGLIEDRGRQMVTLQAIRKGYRNPRWMRYGYLNARQRISPARRGLADQAAVKVANHLGWSDAQFFAWLNSAEGRHYGEWAADRDMTYTDARLSRFFQTQFVNEAVSFASRRDRARGERDDLVGDQVLAGGPWRRRKRSPTTARNAARAARRRSR